MGTGGWVCVCACARARARARARERDRTRERERKRERERNVGRWEGGGRERPTEKNGLGQTLMHASKSHRSARICGRAHTDTCLCMYLYHMYTYENVCTHTDAYLHASTTISGVLRCRSEQSGRRRSEWCKNARRVITNAPCGAWPIPTAVCDLWVLTVSKTR